MTEDSIAEAATPNYKLATLLDWAMRHDINLDEATVSLSQTLIIVTFAHQGETRENFRAIKRAIDGFESKG